MAFLKYPFVLLCFACFAGFGAVSFQSVFLAVDLFSSGHSGVTGYYLGWFIPSGVILFPALTWCKKNKPTHLVPTIVGLELCGLVAAATLIGSQPSPVLVGFINALVVTGYFQLFHLAVAGVTTDHNRTKELATAKIVSQVGGIVGASVGGFISADIGITIPFLLSALCFVAATLALAVISPRVRSEQCPVEGAHGEVLAEPLIEAITHYPRQNIGVILEVFTSSSSSFFFPVLLMSLGVAPALIGLFHATRLAAALFLAPLSHSGIHSGVGREFMGAAALGIVGWLLLMVTQGSSTPLLVVAFLFGCQGFLFALGLEVRWYARRSMSQILARELMLTAGRLLAIPLIAWAAFRSPSLYILIGFLGAFLIYPYGRWLMKSDKERVI